MQELIDKHLAALERAPSDDKPFLELESLFEGSARWDELLHLYESRAATFPDSPGAARILARAGDLLRLKLSNNIRAEQLYRRALAARHNEPAALDGLRAIYEGKGDLAALAAILERRAAGAPEDESASIWMELGRTCERLNRRDRAVLAYQRAAKAAPANREAFEAAFANLVAMGRYRMALTLLDSMGERFGTEGLAPRYAQIGEALADSPPDHPMALHALDAALEIDAEDVKAARLHDLVRTYRDTWRERVRALRLEANDERDRHRRARLFLSVALAHAAFDGEADARKKAREYIENALLLWPGMPQALDALERMAAETNDWKGLDSFLDKLAANTKERSATVDILLRLAVLRVVQFADGATALDAALRAAELDPARAEPVGLAADFLLDLGRAEEAKTLLERHLVSLADPHAQITLRLRLAELLESRLSDKANAQVQLEAALAADPGCLEAARRLVPLYEAEGEPEKLAHVLELALPALSDIDEKVATLGRIAEMYGDLLDKPADAVRALARAILLKPGRATLRKEIERYAAAAQAWETVVSTYRAAASLAEPQVRAVLLRRAAELLDSPLGRLADSIALWRQVLELEPQDSEALAAVESLLERTGAHAELAASHERQLREASDPKEQRLILEKMARSLEESGGRPAEAADVYRRLLELDPDSIPTLERYLEACTALERWAEVAEVAGKLAERAEEPEAARDWMMRRAQALAERLGRKEEAARILLQVFGGQPDRPGLVAELEKLSSSGILSLRIAEALYPRYLQTGDYGRAAAALQTRVAGTSEPGAQRALMIELAGLHEEKLADLRAALSWLEKAFKLAPGDRAARERLEQVASDLGAQAELGAVFVEIAEGVSDESLVIELLLRASALAELASEADLSIQALERGLARFGNQAELLQALHRVAQRAERWTDCERALRLRLEVEAEERVPLLLELAGVAERLGKPSEGAAALKEAVEAGAGTPEVLSRLSKLYEQAGDLQGLKESLDRELRVAEESGDREGAARLRLKLSRMLEEGDRDSALRNYAAVLAERPTDPEALAALERMLQAPETREAAARALVPAYEIAKEHRKLVYALEILAESAADAAEKAAVLKRAAQVHAFDLRQGELAFATLARALRLVPTDAQLRVATRKAAEECDSLDAYAEILDESAEGAPGVQAVPLLRELAEVCERKLADRDRAVEAYRSILELDPENLDALRGLHRLYRLAERWEDLAETCRRLAKVVFDDQERVLLLREAGTLFEGVLDRKEEAAACLRALSELDPLDRDAAIALERLYEQLERPQDLAFALELRRAQEGGSAAGREAAFRLADLKRNLLNDPTGALQIYGQIIADDPSHVGARAALEAWAKSGGPGSIEAVKLVDPVLERAGEHPRRVALRDARLAGASGEEKARLAAEIRRIYEVDMGRAELAFMAACRAWAEGIDRERVQVEMERLARDTNSVEELAEVYESVVEKAKPGEEVVATALRRAAQLRGQAGETDQAVELWTLLLQEVPGDREALEALARLHERNQNARELAEVYRQQAALAQEPAQRAHLLLQAGQALLKTGDHEAAVELGRQVLVIAPKSREALALLERAYDRLELAGEQADVLRLLAEVTEEPPARRTLLLRRAALLETEGDPAEAVEAYAKVLAESPGESSAVAGLERLFDQEQTRPLAARVLEDLYRSVDDARSLCEVLEVKAGLSTKEDRLETLQEIARLRESLGQRPLAFAALLRCFRDDSSQAEIRDELERLAAETGAFEELAAAYEDELERGASEELQLELWH
ncbi:MAG: tetratricopeptide repeat protein, partial [Myxococcales bacterium]